MNEILEFLPFLIPLLVAQAALLAYTLYHIFTHQHYRYGSRMLWVIVTIVLCNFVGPILYLILGREES